MQPIQRGQYNQVIFLPEHDRFIQDNLGILSHREIYTKLNITKMTLYKRIQQIGATRLRDFSDNDYFSIEKWAQAMSW